MEINERAVTIGNEQMERRANVNGGLVEPANRVLQQSMTVFMTGTAEVHVGDV